MGFFKQLLLIVFLCVVLFVVVSFLIPFELVIMLIAIAFVIGFGSFASIIYYQNVK